MGGAQEQVGVKVPGAPVAWKPNSVARPEGSWPLWAAFVNRTAPVVPLRVTFQELVMVAPEGSVSATDQPFTGEDPAVTRTVATKPPVQALTDTEAEQAPVGGGGLVGGGLVGGSLGGGVPPLRVGVVQSTQSARRP